MPLSVAPSHLRARPAHAAGCCAKGNAAASCARPGRPDRGDRLLAWTGWLIPALGLMLLAACGQREIILEGERLDTRAVISPDSLPAETRAQPVFALSLPAARANAQWTQRGGNAAHDAGHVALGAAQGPIFATSIGAAEDRRHRITADPIIGAGLVFVMDPLSRVTAVTPSGQTAWTVDLTPPRENNASASGGGLALEEGRLIATSGFGEVIALDAASGRQIWRQRLGAPISGAATIAGGTVYVLGRDGTGWAIRAEDGRSLWKVNLRRDIAGWQGYAAPAVDGDLVIFPGNSGQLLAVDRRTGEERWSAQVAGSRIGRAIALIRDMTGEPVIAGNQVIAGTSSGRIAAFDRATGAQLWSHDDGALSVPVVAGNSVFAIDDDSRLIRLDRNNGALVWATPLPEFVDQRVKKQEQVWAHYGPVLAGGRLFVTSSDGLLRSFDPASGGLVGQVAIPGGAATAPTVAGGTLYVTSRAGNLLAYR